MKVKWIKFNNNNIFVDGKRYLIHSFNTLNNNCYINTMVKSKNGIFYEDTEIKFDFISNKITYYYEIPNADNFIKELRQQKVKNVLNLE